MERRDEGKRVMQVVYIDYRNEIQRKKQRTELSSFVDVFLGLLVIRPKRVRINKELSLRVVRVSWCHYCQRFECNSFELFIYIYVFDVVHIFHL